MTEANSQWIISNHVLLEPGSGGLPRLRVQTAHSIAHVYLHGAHVTHFELRGKESGGGLLFLSKASHFTEGKAIRGGVPVIFPWFGPRDGLPGAPMHGFARTSLWRFEEARLAQDECVDLTLRLESSDVTRALWPSDFVLRHTIRVGTELSMQLQVQNTGREAFAFEEALHTYLGVGDVQSVRVDGVAGCDYLDKTEGGRRKHDTAQTIRFTGETDRVYLDATGRCVVHDQALGRQIIVDKDASATTVVWNPWSAKAAALADLGNYEWRHFVCVETANAAENRVTLAPGATHTMTAIVRRAAAL
jgi:D-hexose-6-phosphate mutarotase